MSGPVRSALFMLVLSAMVGCMGKPVPETRFYVLSATADPAPAPAGRNGVSILLGDIVLPDYLERGQIVRRATANRLAMSEFDQWGGNLRKDMARVLSANLGRLLNTPNVMTPPVVVSGRVDFQLQIVVLAFERMPEGQVGLSVRWLLTDGNDRRLVASRQLKFTHAVPNNADKDAVVAAMSALLGDLSNDIASAIRNAD